MTALFDYMLMPPPPGLVPDTLSVPLRHHNLYCATPYFLSFVLVHLAVLSSRTGSVPSLGTCFTFYRLMTYFLAQIA